MIFQSDLILRSALIQGFEDIRKKLWMIDDIFSQLAQDPYLSNEFGYRNIQQIKDWFKRTDIPVVMQHRLEKVDALPCVSVALINSPEATDLTVLGDGDLMEDLDDTQTVKAEDVTDIPIKVIPAFTPKAYNPTTGDVTLPDDLNTEFVFPGQILVDTRNNKGYPILECIDDHTFRIAKDVKGNFEGAIVIPQFQALNLARKRTYFRENYQLGVHAAGEAHETIWLHSIVVYILLRYKKTLFEARGLELSTFSSSDLAQNIAFGNQNVYSRFVNLTCKVESNWIDPDPDRKIEGIRINSLKIMYGGKTPPALLDQVNKQGWKMEEDE